MTAKSEKHGIIFARGDFEYSLYLALARGQKERGGKSAFGLKVAVDGLTTSPRGLSYRPCCMVERGCYNYRWPFNEFCLHVDKPVSATTTPHVGDISSDISHHCICPGVCGDLEDGRVYPSVGTFSLLSFVKDGVLYQVLRLSPRCQPNEAAERAELILTIESPMRLQSFCGLNKRDSKRQEVPLRKCDNDEHRACLCGSLPSKTGAAGTGIHWQAELFNIDVSDGTRISIPLRRLKGRQEKKDHCSKTGDGFDSLPRFKADIPPIDISNPHVYIARYRILELSTDSSPSFPPMPSHTEISEFVRNGPPEAPGTSAMWQYIFDSRQEKMDSISELCEGSVVGRCLEKILDVDIVPATVPRQPPSKATSLSSRASSSPSGANPSASEATLFPSAVPSRSFKATASSSNASPSLKAQSELLVDQGTAKSLGTAPETTPSPSLALVSNMFLKANVDLKSLL